MISRRCFAGTLLAIGALLASAALGAAADQSVPADIKDAALAKTPEPAPAAAIPLAEVATRGTVVAALLRSYEGLQAPTPAVAAIQQQLPEVDAHIGLEIRKMLRLLQEGATLDALEGQERLWVTLRRQTTTWMNALTDRAAQVEKALAVLASLRQTWTRTRDAARAAKAPGAILQEIVTVLAAIEAAQGLLQAHRGKVLDLQNNVAQEVARCQWALAQVTEAQKQALVGLLTRDTPPIWSAELRERARAEGPRRIRDIAAGLWAEIVLYVRDPSRGLPYHVVVLVVLAALLYTARRWVHRAVAADEGASAATAVFDRPFSAALLLTLIGATTVFLPTPTTVRDLLQILALAPAIRLTRPVFGTRPVLALYALGVLFALGAVREVFGGVPLLEPALLVLEMLGAMAALGYSLTFGNLPRSPAPGTEPERRHALRVVARLVLLLAAAGLGAAVLGYLSLARLLASGLVGSAYLALVLGACVRVATGLAALLFRMWPVLVLRMVAHHREDLERRVRRVLIWFAVVAWFIRTLYRVGFLGPVVVLGQSLLAAKLERGALSISVEDILAFVVTMWLAYLLSAFLRFLLEEDIYPRMGLARGLSYALSSLLNYGLLTLGFLAGLAVLGLDLTKLTVLAGAFGVGIGFGLQSMVNNFVSGLILLFERPIHVDDIIEAGDILGTVRRIGIRASVVRTWQGAEIIVPNAQLITERVTNWTYSDRQRRIDLPVGVSYGSPPRKVMEILEAVAHTHPQVLRQPVPKAYFTGFGDSSLNFELRVWTDQFENWFQIRSELATAVYDAGQAAGISFPFPQREVRILQDGPGRAAAGEGLPEPASAAGAPVARGERKA